MKSTTTIKIQKCIIGMINNIQNKPIPVFVVNEYGRNKRVSPPQIKKEKDVRKAQIEVLVFLQNYITKLENE